MLRVYKENIKWEDLGQEKSSGFETWLYYTRYWLKKNSVGTLSASRITLPLVSISDQQIKLQGRNRRLKEKNESWPRKVQLSDHRCEVLI